MLQGKILVKISKLAHDFHICLMASTCAEDIESAISLPRCFYYLLTPSFISFFSFKGEKLTTSPLQYQYPKRYAFESDCYHCFIDTNVMKEFVSGAKISEHFTNTYVYCLPSELPIFLYQALHQHQFSVIDIRQLIKLVVTSQEYKALCEFISQHRACKDFVLNPLKPQYKNSKRIMELIR